MISNGKTVPFKFNFGAPSCVPATNFETAGAVLDANNIEELMRREEILYLSEMMNFPGVLNKDQEVRRKLLSPKNITSLLTVMRRDLLEKRLSNTLMRAFQQIMNVLQEKKRWISCNME